MTTRSHENRSQDELWMRQTLQLAQHAELAGEVPIGAIAVLNNEVIGKGWNCPIANSDPTAHAEIIALRAAAQTLQNYRLVDVVLYVTLEPCAMCVGAMLQARIKRLVFGANDSKAGAVVSVFQLLDSNQLNHRVSYQGGILASECGSILSRFFQKRRAR